MEYLKIYVPVKLYVNESGKIFPLSIFYGDREFIVDKITDERMAPPRHVGGLITRRYDCLISGRNLSLYSEYGGKWFIEKRNI